MTRRDLSGREALALMGEPRADEDERLARLLALAGVNRSLLPLHPEPDRCRSYLRRPCPDLGGTAPLHLMLAGGPLPSPGWARRWSRGSQAKVGTARGAALLRADPFNKSSA